MNGNEIPAYMRLVRSWRHRIKSASMEGRNFDVIYVNLVVSIVEHKGVLQSFCALVAHDL